MVERRVKVVDSGLIFELARRRCVLGKDSLRVFLIRAKQSISVVVVQPDKRLANRTPKEVLCVGVVK